MVTQRFPGNPHVIPSSQNSCGSHAKEDGAVAIKGYSLLPPSSWLWYFTQDFSFIQDFSFSHLLHSEGFKRNECGTDNLFSRWPERTGVVLQRRRWCWQDWNSSSLFWGPGAMSECPLLCQPCSQSLLAWALDSFAIPCRVIVYKLQNIWNVCSHSFMAHTELLSRI